MDPTPPAPKPCRAVCSFAGAVVAVVVGGAFLAGCAGPAGRGGSDDRDGPGRQPPPGLLQVPDAEPKLEPIRPGGANKPYTVWGQGYVPLPADAPLSERGLASWYGRKFNGKPTASGELYDMYAMTAAHPTLPIPSYARIRNPANGREVVVRINDRGPFKSRRIVDVSYTAALKLDILRGVALVELERITADEIRAGTWRRDVATGFARAPAGPIEDIVVAAPASAVAVPAADALPVATTAAPADAVLLPPATRRASPVPVEVGAPTRAATDAARGFWVQLGAFRQQEGAVELRRQVEARVDGISPLLTVLGDAPLFRLQAGPYATREAARDAADRLRGALGLVPVLLERR